MKTIIIQHSLQQDFMTSAASTVIQSDMAYQWLSSNGMDFQRTCDLSHGGVSCIVANFQKSILVGKVGYKYYFSFQLIPLLLRLRKCKSTKEALKMIGKSTIEYVRSILFMILLVVGMKTLMCSIIQAGIIFNERSIIGSSLIGSSSIMMENESKRIEIGSFVMAKAFVSAYKVLKRRGLVSTRNEMTVMHMILMAAIYYIYSQQPEMLKFRNIFEKILGD